MLLGRLEANAHSLMGCRRIRGQGLTQIVMQAGLRAYVGKVCMDRNSPIYYQHSQEQNLADTEAFVGHIRSRPKDASHS